MQPPSRRRDGTSAALALLLALAAGCGSGGIKPSVQLVDGATDHVDSSSDHHTDGTADTTDAVVVGHCCVMQPSDASSTCQELDHDGSLGVSEPCLRADAGSTYGRWTCGPGAEAPVCANNGLSCGLGDPCRLVDVGCPGVVQTCNFKPYTPPPG